MAPVQPSTNLNFPINVESYLGQDVTDCRQSSSLVMNPKCGSQAGGRLFLRLALVLLLALLLLFLLFLLLLLQQLLLLLRLLLLPSLLRLLLAACHWPLPLRSLSDAPCARAGHCPSEL